MHRTIACSIQVTLSHVVVPRGHGEIARDLVVVEVVSPRQPTQIGCNELAPVCLAAYGLKLYLLKVAPCLRHKVAMLKQQSRIAAAGNKRNLIPAIIGLAPVRGGPVLIERIERAEAPPQPLLKLRKGRRTRQCTRCRFAIRSHYDRVRNAAPFVPRCQHRRSGNAGWHS